MSLLRLLAEIEGLENTLAVDSIRVATDINPRLEKAVARLSRLKDRRERESVLVEIEKGRYVVRGHKEGETKVGTDREELVNLLTKWAKTKKKIKKRKS